MLNIYTKTKIYVKLGTKITKIGLFVSRKNNKEKIYHYMNEFTEIEEIKETFNEINENVTNIEFKKNKKGPEKKVVLVKIHEQIPLIKAEHISLPQKLKILNQHQKICTLKSKNINIKLLLKIEARIINY